METNINNRNGDGVKYNSVNDYNKHHGERYNYYQVLIGGIDVVGIEETKTLSKSIFLVWYLTLNCTTNE